MISFKSFLNWFSKMATQRLVSVDYEVYGKVQGVFFRKHTQIEARKLQLVGWVKNTSRETVVGTVQGPEDKVNEMKHWLSKVGSKASEIVKCDFKKEKTITSMEYKSFEVDRNKDRSSKPNKHKAGHSKDK